MSPSAAGLVRVNNTTNDAHASPAPSPSLPSFFLARRLAFFDAALDAGSAGANPTGSARPPLGWNADPLAAVTLAPWSFVGSASGAGAVQRDVSEAAVQGEVSAGSSAGYTRRNAIQRSAARHSRHPPKPSVGIVVGLAPGTPAPSRPRKWGGM